MSRKGFFISKRKTVLLIQKSKKFRRKEIKKKEIAATITETWRDQKNIVDQVTEISNSELRMKAANEIINNFHKKHKVWFFEKFLRKKVETQKQKVETQQDSVLYSLF